MVKNYNEILYNNETLYTQNLTLRKFRINDCEDILEYGSDAETLKYLDWEGINTIDEAKSSITDFFWSRPGIYAIELNDTKKCIGCIDLRLNIKHDKASFGYVLNRKYWGKGYMTEALNTLLNLCFEKLNLQRVESTHYIGNEGSGAVMQKCKMKLEGVCEKEVKIKDIFHDVAHYAILNNNYSIYK